jgi:hypothetical protein
MPAPVDSTTIVIGAGSAGLGAAAELRRRGVDALVLERTGEIGSSWASRYDGLHLNTFRSLSAPRHSRLPRSAGRWPAREALVEHLREYARRERIEIEFGVSARRIERASAGYEIETTDGRRAARFVVIATGFDHTPSLPAWPGAETFEGELIHARDYRNAAPFRDRDVLVVGPGNTGTEIAVQLQRGGARRVRLAIRTAPNIVPLESHGIPLTFVARLAELAPEVVVNRIGVRLQRNAWGDLGRYGLPPAPHGIATEIRVKGMGPVVDRGFVAFLKAGLIELVPAVEAFDGAAVRLAGGARLRPDAVIAATGYRMGLEPLVGHLGVLDDSGRPVCVRGEAHPVAPGLHFNGYWLPLSGELPAMRRTTKRIGRDIARAV